MSGSGPMNVFDIAGRAMSAQLVRLNATASNMANAGNVTGSAAEAYRAIKPVFQSVTETPGVSTVKVAKVVTTDAQPTKRHDPNHPLADKNGDVWEAAVDGNVEPVNNAELVSQMATITNSSGIAEMNTSLASIKAQLADNRIGDAAGWIGRSMLVQSNIAAPDATGMYAGQITLPAATSAASVDLVDSSGNVVKTIDLGAQNSGDVTFYWDGKDDTGATVSSSALQVKVNGATPSRVATWATIAAVQSPADGSSTKLITALGSYSPTDALSLS